MPEGFYSVQAIAVKNGRGIIGTLVLTADGYEFNGIHTKLDWKKTACIQGTTRVNAFWRAKNKPYVKFCEGEIVSQEFVLEENKITDLREKVSNLRELVNQKNQESERKEVSGISVTFETLLNDQGATYRSCGEILGTLEEDTCSNMVVQDVPDQECEENGDASGAELNPAVEDLNDSDVVKEKPRDGYEKEHIYPEAPSPESDQVESECLIDGYKVNGDEIICKATGRAIEDVPAETLELSVRAKNCFIRSKRVIARQDHDKVMISDLLRLTWTRLISVRMLGIGTAEEILAELTRYLSLKSSEAIDNNDDVKQNDTIDRLDSCGENILPAISEDDFPELDPDIPVLAPEYAAINGWICNRKTLTIIQDSPIDSLDLSRRASFCLSGVGIKMVSSLVGMTYDELRQIRNMGILSVNEITEKLEKYLDAKLVDAYGKVVLKSVSEKTVIGCFHVNEFEPKSYGVLLSLLPDADETELQEILKRLVEKGKLCYSDNMFSIPHVSFYDEIQMLAQSSEKYVKAAGIIQLRASGSTLSEIAQIEGITRERVRQLESKIVRKLTGNKGRKFDEDRYAYLFCTYRLDKEFYHNYLNLSEKTMYYLHLFYSEGASDYELGLDDKMLSVGIRQAIDKYIHRNFVQLGERYILAQRSDLAAYVIEKYCRDEVTIDEFISIYNRILNDNGMFTEKLAISDSEVCSWTNRLADSGYLLWKQNSRLRYYDITGTDFSELLDTLNLGQYHNIELSSRKFFLEFPELMERYDIRDEYELHNLLKKIHAERENPEIIFKRMPSIQFGVADREAKVKELLFSHAPITVDDFAKLISSELGYLENTIKASWFRCIDEYYHQGVFSVEFEDMPDEQMKRLKEELTEDFYSFDEIRTIYQRLFPDASLNLISTYNLKRLGYLVMSSYALKNYPSAGAYFEYLLTSRDVFNLKPLMERFGRLATFSTCLAEQRSALRIIEFEPYQYISICRLERMGYDVTRLRKYSDRVWSNLADVEYFTIHSLRKNGFDDELDGLGFADLFYSSLLKADSRFSWQRVGNNVVLNSKGVQFSVHDFLVSRINAERSVDLDEFIHELESNYGIVLDRYTILEKVKGSDVYYDHIMDKLYKDYLTYFEEI